VHTGAWANRSSSSIGCVASLLISFILDRILGLSSWIADIFDYRSLMLLAGAIYTGCRIKSSFTRFVCRRATACAGFRSQDRSTVVKAVPTSTDVPGDSKIIALPVSVESAKDVEGSSIRPAFEQASTPGGLDVSVEDPPANDSSTHAPNWVFRGFVEPMMENGHEVG
jgi:hypothetical protein